MTRSFAFALVSSVIAFGAGLLPSAFAQSDRMTYQGEFAYPGFFGRNEGPQNAHRVVNEPYIAFRARYIHQSWALIGTPVHSCEIRWEYTDHQGQATPDTVTVMGLELDLSAPDVRFALEAHPGIVRVGETRTGAAFVEVRLDALPSRPSLYDLDFLVPLEGAAQAPARDRPANSDTDARLAEITASQARTRCISGALGRSGGPGLNTPYAFDADELLVYPQNASLSAASLTTLSEDGVQIGRFVDADTAAQTFTHVVLRRIHEEPYEASGSEIILIDAEFNLVSVIALIQDTLRSAARTAQMARLNSETRQQEAARAAAQAAAANRASATSSRTFEEARFDPHNPPERSMTELMDSIDRRFENLLQTHDPIAPLPAASSARTEVAPEQIGYVRLDASSEDLEALRAQEEQLNASATRFDRYSSALEQPSPPKDLSRFSPPDPQERLEDIVERLAQCDDSSSLFTRRYSIGDGLFRSQVIWRTDDMRDSTSTIRLEDLYRSIETGRFETSPTSHSFQCNDCLEVEYSEGRDRFSVYDGLRVPCPNNTDVYELLRDLF